MDYDTNRVRLASLNGDGVEHEQEQPTASPQRIWWVVGVFLAIQTAALIHYCGQNSARDEVVRQELNENAKLIRQLQERIIVKDLSNLRKGTP